MGNESDMVQIVGIVCNSVITLVLLWGAYKVMGDW